MIRASVAMAVYNGEKYLREQLDSILSQMGQEDELVISYDRSDDNTWNLINEYAENDERIVVLADPGSGVIDNFNHALAHCRGKYLFISDQDDIWINGKIDGMIRVLEETGASLVVHNGVTINASGKVVSNDFFSEERIGPSLWKNFLKSRYSGCCMGFCRELADIVLPIPKDIDAYDRWFGLCAEAFGKIVFADDVWIKHRIHSENYTPTGSRSASVIFHTRKVMLRELLKISDFQKHT